MGEAEVEQQRLEQEFAQYASSQSGRLQAAIEAGAEEQPIYTQFADGGERIQTGVRYILPDKSYIDYDFKEQSPEFAASFKDYTKRFQRYQDQLKEFKQLKSQYGDIPITSRGNILLTMDAQRFPAADAESVVMETSAPTPLPTPREASLAVPGGVASGVRGGVVVQDPVIGTREVYSTKEYRGATPTAFEARVSQLKAVYSDPSSLADSIDFFARKAQERVAGMDVRDQPVSLPGDQYIEIPVRRGFERGTGTYNPSTGQYEVPPAQPDPFAEKLLYRGTTVRQVKGKVAGLTAGTALFVASAPVATVSYTARGVKKLQGLGRTSYVPGEVGSAVADISIGAIPVVARTVRTARYATTPQIVAGPVPVAERRFVSQGTMSGQELTVLDYQPAQMGVSNTPIRKLFGLPGKQVVVRPANTYLTVGKVFIDEDVSRGITATKRSTKSGGGGSLTRLSEVEGSATQIAPEEISMLPKQQQFVAGQVERQPAVFNEEPDLFAFQGTSQRGVPIAGPVVRLERVSNTQRQVLVRTSTSSRNVPVSIGFGQVRQVRDIRLPRQYFKLIRQIPEDSNVYVASLGQKTTKSMRPRASGKVDMSTGVIFVKNTPEITESTTKFIVGKKTGKTPFQVQVDQKQVAANVAGTVSRIPRPRRSYVKPGTVVSESGRNAPTYVGGLGKGRSLYFARGAAEDISVAKTAPLYAKAPVSTSVNERERTEQAIGFGYSNNIRDRIRLLSNERSRSDTIPAFATISANRVREAAVLAPRERVNIVSAFRLNTNLGQRTAPRVAVRPISPRYVRPPRAPPRPPRIKVPRPKFDDDPTKRFVRRPKAKVKDLFRAEVRKRKKFSPVGKAGGFEEAFRTGKRSVLDRIAASLRVVNVRTGKAVKLPKDQFLRPSKRDVNVLVQTRKTRLSSRGEQFDIISARRGGIF